MIDFNSPEFRAHVGSFVRWLIGALVGAGVLKFSSEGTREMVVSIVIASVLAVASLVWSKLAKAKYFDQKIEAGTAAPSDSSNTPR